MGGEKEREGPQGQGKRGGKRRESRGRGREDRKEEIVIL